jgi:hypothetical protein
MLLMKEGSLIIMFFCDSLATVSTVVRCRSLECHRTHDETRNLISTFFYLQDKAVVSHFGRP